MQRTGSRLLWAIAFLSFQVVGCGDDGGEGGDDDDDATADDGGLRDDGGPRDGGADAGPRDGGARDGGALPDGGVDGGLRTDGGATPDGGAVLDAGRDGGTGVADAGPGDAGRDASVTADGGAGDAGRDGGTDGGVTAYTAAEVQTLFSGSCTSSLCHDASSPEEGMSLVDFMDDTIDVASVQSDLDRIEPGDHEASYLWHKVNGTHLASPASGEGLRMPRGGTALSATQISRLAAYIDAL